MKGWRKGTYFRNARPCTGGTLKELREIRQDFKRFKKLCENGVPEIAVCYEDEADAQAEAGERNAEEEQ